MFLASLSDMHLGSPNTTRAHREGIASCLDHLRGMGLTHLVLSGDILDNWTAPAEVLPPTYEEILVGDDLVIPALQRLSQSGVGIHYLLGNHDFDVDTDLFHKYLPDVRVAPYFTLGNLWVEHGHSYDLFNACGPRIRNPDPAGGDRPLGYYITRIHTKAGRTGSTVNSSAYIQNSMRMVKEERRPGKWTVATIVLDYVIREAGLSYNDDVVMPDGSKIPIWAISEAYADIFRAWEEEKGLFDAIDAILVAIEYMNHAAQDVRTLQKKRLVIFGHSHQATWDDLTTGTQAVTGAYSNDGAWCKTPQTLTLVELASKKYRVTQGVWDGKTIQGDVKVISEGWPKKKPATFAPGRPR